MPKVSRTAAVLASLALATSAATPALAHGGDWGWGGGWDGGRYRHHDGIDGGDVLAGILIIGGIAAIASAASKAKRSEREGDYRGRGEPVPPPMRDGSAGPDAGYGRDASPEWRGGVGFNDAVNRCMDEISRGKDGVDGVDSVNRDAEGWRVQGRTQGGESFSCTVDGEGRIRNISVEGRAI